MPTPLARARRVFASSDNLLARLVTLNIVGKVGSLVVGLGASVALARLLGAADRGLLGLMISASSLGLVLTTFGVPLAVVYFASRRDAYQPGLLGNSIVQAIMLAAVLVPSAAVAYRALADALGHGHGGRVWVLVAALVPVTFLDWTTHAQLQGMLRFGRLAALLIASRIAYAVGVLALVGVVGLGVAGGVMATAAGSAVVILFSLRPILAHGRPRIDVALVRRTLHYGLRVQIGSVFQLANGRLDVIVLQLFRPLSQVGYYVVAQAIAELVINLAAAFQNSVLPLMSLYEGDARARVTSTDSVRHHGILAGAAVLANAAFGPLIIFFAFGRAFQPAIVPMLILLPGIWFLGLGIVIQGDLGGRGRPGLSSWLAGLAAGVTVILDFALIPPLGVIGGALASVVAYTTFGIASLIALHKVSRIPVRELVVPTRADFAAYGRFLRGLLTALRRIGRSQT